jgi:hypothetical protein
MKDDSAYFAGRLQWWNGNSCGFIRPDGSTQDAYGRDHAVDVRVIAA